MFKVGDRAVYPTQGIGVIEAIESKDFGGVQTDFYILRIVDSDITIMVPTGNAAHIGLRCPIDKKRVASIFAMLEEKITVTGAIASWSRRQREYNDKIKTGDLFEVAEVLRELYAIREGKELSYGEKKVLELARKLLVKEVALAEEADEDVVTARVEKIFLN
jgi:CarD family transcriptional regulator